MLCLGSRSTRLVCVGWDDGYASHSQEETRSGACEDKALRRASWTDLCGFCCCSCRCYLLSKQGTPSPPPACCCCCPLALAACRRVVGAERGYETRVRSHDGDTRAFGVGGDPSSSESKIEPQRGIQKNANTLVCRLAAVLIKGGPGQKRTKQRTHKRRGAFRRVCRASTSDVGRSHTPSTPPRPRPSSKPACLDRSAGAHFCDSSPQEEAAGLTSKGCCFVKRRASLLQDGAPRRRPGPGRAGAGVSLSLFSEFFAHHSIPCPRSTTVGKRFELGESHERIM